MKFLTTNAGGLFEKNHNLGRLFQLLQANAPEAAKFLKAAFAAAVVHYRYNPNAANMTHLKSLEQYLEVAGSNEAFQDVRYWELEQSLDEVIVRTIYLSLHIELLYALSEILLDPKRPLQTVNNRVDRAVQHALFPKPDLAYAPSTTKEDSVRAYLNWLRTFSSGRDALADAVQRSFNIGDEFTANIARNAYDTLRSSSDLAVRYFANTLGVLPKQPRIVIPLVQWLGPEPGHSGSVTTPAGTPLGFIERGLDGLWYITPMVNGLVAVSAIAETQTDALSYLAKLLSRLVTVTVDGQVRSLRIVGEEYYLIDHNSAPTVLLDDKKSDEPAWTHKVVFWNTDHAIETGQRVRIEVRRNGLVDKVEGTVTKVLRDEVYLSGKEMYDLDYEELS